MGSLALLVDHRGSRIELGANETLVVHRQDGHCERVGLRALGEVVLIGDVELDSRVLRALASANVALSCLPLRGADGAALLLGSPNRAAMVRHAQHRCYADDGLRLALARITIRYKVGAAEASAAISGSGWAAAIESAADLANLMGVEGAASRRHFERIRSRLPGELGFCQRQRQPPRDPVNALLSLCYTLIQPPAAQMLVRAGLDPQLGFLHEAHRDRPALVLDLIEAARPHLDEFVVRQFTNGTLGVRHFHRVESGGMRLTLEGRRCFFPRWFAEGTACARGPMKTLLAEWLSVLHAEGSHARRRCRKSGATP